MKMYHPCTTHLVSHGQTIFSFILGWEKRVWNSSQAPLILTLPDGMGSVILTLPDGMGSVNKRNIICF